MMDYTKHCMFSGNRLEDGREVFGSLVIEVSANPITETEIWHIIQLGSWAGKQMISDDLVDPESVCMYLGQDDRYGHGIYTPLKEVADSVAVISTLAAKSALTIQYAAEKYTKCEAAEKENARLHAELEQVKQILAAYQRYGAEPCDYATMRAATDKADRCQNDLSALMEQFSQVSAALEKAKAEQDGKLVNHLPGDTVYDRFGMEWTVTTSEIHKFDDGALRYLYRCGHPGTDDYCALYVDEILTREEAEEALQKEAEGR